MPIMTGEMCELPGHRRRGDAEHRAVEIVEHRRAGDEREHPEPARERAPRSTRIADRSVIGCLRQLADMTHRQRIAFDAETGDRCR